MSSRILIKWGGLALIIGAATHAAGQVAMFASFGVQHGAADMLTTQWAIILISLHAAVILVMLGFIALYARQAQYAGALGVLGFVFVVIGTMMESGYVYTAAYIGPTLAKEAPEVLRIIRYEPTGMLALGIFSILLFPAVGWIMFGLASLRAGVLPKGATWLILIGTLLNFVFEVAQLPLGMLLLNAGLVWMGYFLWSQSTSLTAS